MNPVEILGRALRVSLGGGLFRQVLAEKRFVFRDQDSNPHERSPPRLRQTSRLSGRWWDSEDPRKASHACLWDESLSQQSFPPGDIGKGV